MRPPRAVRRAETRHLSPHDAAQPLAQRARAHGRGDPSLHSKPSGEQWPSSVSTHTGTGDWEGSRAMQAQTGLGMLAARTPPGSQQRTRSAPSTNS